MAEESNGRMVFDYYDAVELIRLIEIHADISCPVRCDFIGGFRLHGGTGFFQAIHTSGDPVVTATEK